MFRFFLAIFVMATLLDEGIAQTKGPGGGTVDEKLDQLLAMTAGMQKDLTKVKDDLGQFKTETQDALGKIRGEIGEVKKDLADFKAETRTRLTALENRPAAAPAPVVVNPSIYMTTPVYRDHCYGGCGGYCGVGCGYGYYSPCRGYNLPYPCRCYGYGYGRCYGGYY